MNDGLKFSPLLSFITHGRNDSYMGDFIWRLSLCINKIANNFAKLNLLREIEILINDWGSDEGKLHQVLELNDHAMKVTQFIIVPPAIASKYNGDGIYSYPHAANVAIRRAKGKFIFSMDSDAYMPVETAKSLWKIINNKFPAIFDLDNTFFWLSRKHIPNYFLTGKPSIQEIDNFIYQNPDKLVVTSKCDIKNFRGGAVAIFAKREILHNIRGYNEKLIYWGWSDIDIHYRLAILHSPCDLWDYGAQMYHLEHYHKRGYVVDNRKLNPMKIPDRTIVNPENWGLWDENVEIISPY